MTNSKKRKQEENPKLGIPASELPMMGMTTSKASMNSKAFKTDLPQSLRV